MRVKYKGSGDLKFSSAPSRNPYLFVAGVFQEVRKEDEQFFRNKAANPNNPWEVETIVEKVGNVGEKIKSKIRGGKGRGDE